MPMTFELRPAHCGRTAAWWRAVLLCGALVAALLLLAACRDERKGGELQSAPSSGPVASTAASPGRGVGLGPPGPSGSRTADPAVVVLGAEEVDDEVPTDQAEGSPDCPARDPALKPLQLLRYRFSSGVEHKKPVDKLYVARPGQRVWAHLTVRNRSGRDRCVHVELAVNGQSRTEIDLEVGHSWSWRTWAYITLRPTDRAGRLELTVTDDQGRLLLREHLPIVPESPG